MSTKETVDQRIKTLTRRIDDLTSLLEDLRSEHTTLKQRFDRLRDDHSDQLASLRGRVTASDRWANRRSSQDDQLQPLTMEELAKNLPESDRRLLATLLANRSPPPPSGQSQQVG